VCSTSASVEEAVGRLARPTSGPHASRSATVTSSPTACEPRPRATSPRGAVGGPKSVPKPLVRRVGDATVTDSSASAAREALDRIAEGALHQQLVGEVARKFQRRAADEVEDAFQEAYTRALTRCHWRREKEVYGWLRRAMVNWLIDRGRRERLEFLADTSSGQFLDVADARDEPLRVLGRQEDREDIKDVHLTVLDRLSERQRRVISLHADGTERKEIARRVAASENAVKKDLKRVFRVARDEVIGRSGHGCSEGESLVIRYAFGLGGDAIPARAQLHLAQCERCGEFFRELESWRERVAALVPLPAVEQASPGALERSLANAMDALGHVKHQLADGGTHLKNHAAATYSRAIDPTPLAGARPGAATAAVATCLGIVGGATYCVEHSLNPIGELAGIVQEQPVEPEKTPSDSEPQPTDPIEPHSTPPPVPELPPQPVEPPPPPPEPAARPEPAPLPPPAPPPEPTPPPVQFGEPASAPAQAVQPSVRPSSPTPAEPAPAPSGGSGLYGP
jgi:RNA polymerase sigma factor (sigma-70 family)